jgi:hypothetical protein
MDALASLVSHSEQPIVRAHAARLQRAAREQSWPGPRPVQLRRRICFVVAAIAPTLPPRRLSLLARYALWSFPLDDRLDASGLDPDSLVRTRDSVVRVTAGSRAPAGDPLLVGLAGVRDELARHDRSGALVDRFAAAVRDAVDAGVEQALLSRAVAGGAAAPPTPERYLALGARATNYRSFAFVLLAVVSGSLPPATLEQVEPALWHACRAVRLGNDLPSAARDRAQSVLNILDLGVTRPWVVAEIDRCVRAHDDTLAAVAGAGAAVPALRRSLRVTVDLFRLTDLR